MRTVDRLTASFYSGAAVTSDVPSWAQIAIDGHPYVIEPSMYERTTIERFRNPYDQSNEPGEHSLNTRGPWLRSQSRWDHGAGQDFWDAASDPVSRSRFFTSKGIDVWSSATGQTSQNRAQLLNDSRNIRSSAATNLDVLAVNGYLYVTDGQQVYRTSDPTGASPTFTSAVIHNGEAATTVKDLTTDGSTVWAALGANGIHKTVVGATSSAHLSAYAATLVEYANGRLIAAATNELVEIDSVGASTVLKTHDNASFTWKSVCGAPNGIYAAGNAGDRCEIYYIGLKADFSLDVPRYAGTLPDGETMNAMFFYNGVMLLATSVGLRLAQVTSADGLSYASAVKITNGASCLEPQAEFVWFGWSNYDGSSTGLGRASLAAFTDDLVPAYASDLMASGSGTVLSVCTFGTRRYFAVSGAGIFAEFGDLVSTGTINVGWINYSTTERKTAVSVDIRHEPLAGEVTVGLIQEDGTVETVGTTSTSGSLGPDTPMGVTPTSSEAFQLTFTLTRSADATVGPVLRRWTFRSLITPWRADEIHIPINLKQDVTVNDFGDGHRLGFSPLDEWLWLKTLEATGIPVTYQEGTQSYAGYIEQVSSPADKTRKWTSDRSFLQGIVMVRFITLSPAA